MRPLLKAQLEESAGARRPIPARSFSNPPLRSPLCRAWHPKQQTPLSGETPQSGETPLSGFPLAGGGVGVSPLSRTQEVLQTPIDALGTRLEPVEFALW